MSIIPYGHQDIDQADIEAVIKVLKSDYLTQGPYILKFEEEIASYVGANYACATSNGTSALHLACLALGLEQGDILWTVPNTFVASANCGLYCNADVDFVDIDENTLNIDINALKFKLEQAKKVNKLPKILVVVHFAGFPCDMQTIHQLSGQFGFYIIEDAAHALGAKYLGHKIGDCKYSDLCTFSFHPIKSITTGEGGMVMTNSEVLIKRLQLLRTHGITKDPDAFDTESEGEWFYQQIALGFNYRMSDIQAALGLSQLSRINQFISKREDIAARYDKSLSDTALNLPVRDKNAHSAWHLYVIQTEDKESRSHLYQTLRKENIFPQVHYIPIHLQPVYRKFGFKQGDFPVAENYYQHALSLPIYYGLEIEDQDRVIDTIKRALE